MTTATPDHLLLTYAPTDRHIGIHPEYQTTQLAQDGRWLVHSVGDALTFAQDMVGHGKDIGWTPVIKHNQLHQRRGVRDLHNR